MTKYLLVAALIIGVGMVGYVGCGGFKDRIDVAADKTLEEIDKLLGKWQVARKTVERKLNEVQEVTEKVSEQHVRFKVKYERSLKKQEKVTEEKATVRNNLKRLNGLLNDAKAEGSVEVDSKTFTSEELNTMATEQLKKLEFLKTQNKQVNIEVGLLKKNLDVLAKQKSTSTTQLKQLKSKIDEIDQKIELLDSQKVAQSMSNPDMDINEGFNDLQASVDKMIEDLDVEMAVQDDKLEARLLELEGELSSTTDIDDIFGEKDDVSSTQSAIEKALQDDE